MSEGRVLSEEETAHIESTWDSIWSESKHVVNIRKLAELSDTMPDLIATIRAEQAKNDMLLSAAQHLHETVNTFWIGDCDKATVIKAQSGLVNAIAKAKGE